jgi:hypothetical protein
MSIKPISYEAVRHEYILVRREPERSALVVLLRAVGAERPETADRLRAAGLTRECEVTWILPLADAEVNRGLERIYEALGDSALFDAGTSFDAASARRLRGELPAAWRGRHLLHLGGTHRCIVFDGTTSDEELSRAFREAEAAYFAADYHPLTE